VSPRRAAIGTALLVACGVWLILLGLYFVLVRPALLPGDLRYMATPADVLRNVAPGAERWLNLVFTVLGGYIAGSGVLTILAVSAARHPRDWIGLALSGALTVGTMATVNFVLDSDFKWILVVPAVVWLAGVVLLARGDGPDPAWFRRTSVRLHDQIIVSQRQLRAARSRTAQTGDRQKASPGSRPISDPKADQT
jgi:hypothetical protein